MAIINANNSTDKDQLVGILYTLRAGLSVISEETMKIKDAEAEYQEVKDQYVRKVKEKTDDCISLKRKIANNEAKIQQQRQKKNELQNEKAGCVSYGIGGFLGPCIVAILITLFGETENSVLLMTCAYGSILFCAIAMNKIATYYIRNVKNKKQYAICDKEIEKLTQENHDAQQALATLESELEMLNHKNPTVLLTLKSKLEDSIIPQSVEIAKSTAASMRQMSAHIIHESDWVNIDLIIYYLTTGRANTLQEALQLVDIQRQTNQLTHEIRRAASHISSVLSSGFAQLGMIMQDSIRELGKQIQSSHLEVVQAIHGEGDRIVKAEELNAALLKKANQTSEDLVEEFKYNQRYWRK